MFGFETNVGGCCTDAVGTTVPTEGVWYHVVGVYDGSNMRLYMNGIEEGIEPESGNLLADAAGVTAIGSRGGDTEFLKAKIDDVRIYNRALTAAEVKQLYKLGTVIIRQ